MELLELMCNRMDKGKITDIQLVENFFDDIDLINSLANTQKFYTVDEYNYNTGHSDAWPGTRTYCLDQQPVLHTLVKHSVEKKFNIESDKHAYFFHRRGTKDNKKDWPHKDSSRYALIVYLSKTNLNSGTVFYNDNQEVITDISFVNNRAILFNGQIPHKSKLNYGEDSDIRLTLNGFFYD